jgi:hypothetical protein
MKLGRLSDLLTTKLFIIFVLQAVAVMLFLGYQSWMDTSIECIHCHSDRGKMERLGHPQFYVTQEMVEQQSHHPNVKCRDCHLGNGRATEPERAHEGMLTAFYVNHEGAAVKRTLLSRKPLLPEGADQIRAMLPHMQEDGDLVTHPAVRNLLWHDRDPQTFNFDPAVASKTCGKSGCHPDEVKQFKTTIMATNFRQRTMMTWMHPYGPQNCGPSFADVPPSEVLKETGFSMQNLEMINKELNVPLTKEQAIAKQKFCNACHAGCLDCHYAPDSKRGAHAFTNKPSSETCGGNGRNTSMCRAGSSHSRRGETYVGGDYSIPTGMKADVHYAKNIHCIDCHTTGIKGMGDMQRKAHCQDCHIAIQEAHEQSVHKNLQCSACHINELRGYQVVVWGPGIVAGQQNPMKKYSLYYGIQGPPILMKDQNGIWMAVKVFPHTVGNYKNDIAASPQLQFRWGNGETRDPYYIVGTFDAPSNNKHLLWLEIQQASHPYGKGRSCESCHKEKQTLTSQWQYMDDQGTEQPFSGGYAIIAGRNGLKVVNMYYRGNPIPMPGYKLEDFASWIYFKDKWQMPGDFSIPTDKIKYRKYADLSRQIAKELTLLDRTVRYKDKKTQKRFSEVKGFALHNEALAIGAIREFRQNLH